MLFTALSILFFYFLVKFIIAIIIKFTIIRQIFSKILAINLDNNFSIYNPTIKVFVSVYFLLNYVHRKNQSFI